MTHLQVFVASTVCTGYRLHTTAPLLSFVITSTCTSTCTREHMLQYLVLLYLVPGTRIIPVSTYLVLYTVVYDIATDTVYEYKNFTVHSAHLQSAHRTSTSTQMNTKESIALIA